MTGRHEFVGEITEIVLKYQGQNRPIAVSGEGQYYLWSCRNCRAGLRHPLPKNIQALREPDWRVAEYLVISASNAYQKSLTTSAIEMAANSSTVGKCDSTRRP